MLLQEKLKNGNFSPSEKLIAQSLLDSFSELEKLSTSCLAARTYTSPAAVVRLAKRLGFSGWNELRQALIAERNYLNHAFLEVDANYPFGPQDSDEQIVRSMASLYEESIKDSQQLIVPDRLHRAVDLIKASRRVVLFALGDLYHLAARFGQQLERIGKAVLVESGAGMHEHTAWQMKADECAIIISYSGETPMILESAAPLKARGIPVIALTSIGNNSLSELADITLPVTTREKAISKIWGFSSFLSAAYILDVLFSCLFARDYQANDAFKKDIAARVETRRKIHNQIICEEGDPDR